MAHVVPRERTVRTVTAVDYPSSDGKPVAESDFQLTVLTYAREALRNHFRAREDVYVAANLLIYHREGDGGDEARVAPDVFVVVGASNHERMSYLLWQEPKAPDWVLEITSRSTRHEDQGRKRELYRRLGVSEYWQYDPTGDYLSPVLQGLELVAGEYEELPSRERAHGTLVMASVVLGLELRVTRRGLRFHDPETGRALLTHAEAETERREERASRQQAETERREERASRQQAEAERQEERAARRQAEAKWRQAEADREEERSSRQQAERERQQAEAGRQQERQARQRAETRIRELEALLRTRTAEAQNADFPEDRERPDV